MTFAAEVMTLSDRVPYCYDSSKKRRGTDVHPVEFSGFCFPGVCGQSTGGKQTMYMPETGEAKVISLMIPHKGLQL